MFRANRVPRHAFLYFNRVNLLMNSSIFKLLVVVPFFYASVASSEQFTCQDRPLLRSELSRLDRTCGDDTPVGSCTSWSDTARNTGDTPDQAIERCEAMSGGPYRSQCGRQVSCSGNVRLCETNTDVGRFFGSTISSVTARCEDNVNSAYRSQCNSNALCR